MSNIPALDESVTAVLRTVSTATLTMVLLKKGIRTSWLCGPVPLQPMSERVVGPAFTLRFVPAREDLATPESYAHSPSLRDAIEAAPSGCVVVIDGCASTTGATLGDILIARLAYKGVVAAVADSPMRDADEIRKIPMPVLSTGVAAPPSIASLAFAGWNELIGCGGVAVRPGDIVVCDNDGAIVIPLELAPGVASAGAEQERFERFVQAKVNAGASVLGLYPPDEAMLGEYQAWLAAGEPSE
jgi:regulator of RNase E activity RraA